MTPKEIETLRQRCRAAIERDGIVKVASKLQVQPPTILRFLSGAGRTHRGTLLQIREGLR